MAPSLSTYGQGVTMPDDLRAAYDLAARPMPDGVTVVWAPLEGISGEYRVKSREIAINSSLRGQDARVLAGVLAHEIRHAEGARHDCADGRRDRAPGGAWTVHADTLDRLAVDHSIWATMFCD